VRIVRAIANAASLVYGVDEGARMRSQRHWLLRCDLSTELTELNASLSISTLFCGNYSVGLARGSVAWLHGQLRNMKAF